MSYNILLFFSINDYDNIKDYEYQFSINWYKIFYLLSKFIIIKEKSDLD